MFTSNVLFADVYECRYLNKQRTDLLKIIFSLPADPYFGAKVDLNIINDKRSIDEDIKAVVIKDKPFLVMSDVQRIKKPSDKMMLFYLTPDRDKLTITNLSIGVNPNAGFNFTKCRIKVED